MKEDFDIRRIAFLVVSLLLASEGASAATTTGASAVALAALVAEHSPRLSHHERRIMERLFDGHLDFAFPANHKITVEANLVVCRLSNVDISARSCELTFGMRHIALTGRKANELYATIAEAGVPPDGAAGSVFESLSHLSCAIDPNEIKQRAGGGASCDFQPGKR